MGVVETSFYDGPSLGEDCVSVSHVVLKGDSGGDHGILSSDNRGVSGGSMSSGGGDLGASDSSESLTGFVEVSAVLGKGDGSFGGASKVPQHNAGCESSKDDDGAPGYIADGCGALIAENKGEEVYGGSVGVEGISRYLFLEQGAMVETPRMSGEEENYAFPGLSPLRTVERENLGGPSRIDISELLDDGRGYCSGYGDAILALSGQIVEDPSIDSSGVTAKEADGRCYMSSSNNCEVNSRCEKNSSKERNQVCSPENAKGFLLPERATGTSHCEVEEGTGCQPSLAQREVSHSVQCTFSSSASFSAFEGLISPQLSHMPNVAVNCLSKHLVAPVDEGANSDAVARTQVCCSNVAYPCQPAENGEMSTGKSGSIIVFRRRNPKRAASLKSSQIEGKSNQLNRPKTNSRKSKEPVNTIIPFSSSIMKIFSNKVKRRRSYSLKIGRHSVWGAVENLVDIFKQNDSLSRNDFDPIQTKNKRSGRARSTVWLRKRQTGQKDGTLRPLKCKPAAPSNSTRASNRRCLQQMYPHVTDYLTMADCQTDLGISEAYGEIVHKLSEQRHGLQREGQHGDKDLESTVTQQASVENTTSDCAVVSSQVGYGSLVGGVDRQLIDPGTSPDSVVFHPAMDAAAMSNEGGTSTDLDAEIGTIGENLEGRVPDYSITADCTSSEALSTSVSVPLHDIEHHAIPVKGSKINGSIYTLRDCPSIEENFHSPYTQNKIKSAFTYSMLEQNMQDGYCRRHSCSRSIREMSTKGRKFSLESNMSDIAEFECCQESPVVESGLETWQLTGQDNGNSHIEACLPEGSVVTTKSNGHKLCRNAEGVGARRASRHDSARDHKQSGHGGKKGNLRKSDSKGKSERDSQALDDYLEAIGGMYLSSVATNTSQLTASAELNNKLNAGSTVSSEDLFSSGMIPLGAELVPKGLSKGSEEVYMPSRAAWVLCDDCQKWRCIPAELADKIDETNCRWTCKDNKDKAFADCSIPQQKTNAEINAELEISDEEDGSTSKASLKEFECSNVSVSDTTSWKLIKSNFFLHRNRKTQNIDEVMVCLCKPRLDGSLGCGDECLNRMVNIECVRGTCPCGNLCSNQQFQKRKYAKFKLIHCGKKGYGLQLKEDVAEGQFLIEYVGEVLDLSAYESRQRYYASRGQKHFYLMTLSGGEVIDACAKGNLGRFINHSCEPNCETQKWFVNGEVCIGLFALRDIKKGEEVTFDYNYERVFGAAAKKCVCGSSKCRGYIGGDPLSTEVIVQGDSDEDCPEPVRVHDDGEGGLDVDDAMVDLDAKIVKNEEISMQVEVAKSEEASMPTTAVISRHSPAIPESNILLKSEDTLSTLTSDVNLFDTTLGISDHMKSEDILCKPVSEMHVLENSVQSTIQAEATDCKSVVVQPLETSSEPLMTAHEFRSESASSDKLVVNHDEVIPNTSKNFPPKLSRSNGTVKRSKSGAKGFVPHKIKEVPIGASSGRFGLVEDKLNLLLDADGGISKHKDATKGYLKLLFATAAEGNNTEGASQSIRDLSLILDALLKTKSRMVLADIINKNGLQMLHNIMKQNRENFKRIPIIRKLFKVLDFLAQKGILTPEHMNKGPPCSGMESFKVSILKLTRHRDMKVHRIARDFRDKWMPRTIRAVELSDRGNGILEPRGAHFSCQPSLYNQHVDHRADDRDAIVCVSEGTSYGANISEEIPQLHFQQVSSAPSTGSNRASVTRVRKRKSRWDQPLDSTSTDSQSLWSFANQNLEASSKFMKPSLLLGHSVQLDVSKQNSEAQREQKQSCNSNVVAKDFVLQCIDEEAPPGFTAPPGFGSPCMDHHDEFPSSSSLAIGEVVMGHVQERYLSHLSVSYGVPVALVQQLGTPGAGGSQSEPQWAVAPGMPFHPFPPLPPYPRGNLCSVAGDQMYASHKGATHGGKGGARLANPSNHSAFGGRPGDIASSGDGRPYSHERVRWPSSSSGRRFFRPYCRNNRKFQGHRPPWPREKNDCVPRGSIRDGFSNISHGKRDASEGFISSEGISENVSSKFHQQSQHD